MTARAIECRVDACIGRTRADHRRPSRPNGSPPMVSLLRGVPAPFTAVRIDAWVLRLLEDDLDRQVALLEDTAPARAGSSCVVMRADGGLWVATGHNRLWTIFSVPRGAWTMASNISGVVAKVSAPVKAYDASIAVDVRKAGNGRR